MLKFFGYNICVKFEVELFLKDFGISIGKNCLPVFLSLLFEVPLETCQNKMTNEDMPFNFTNRYIDYVLSINSFNLSISFGSMITSSRTSN